MSFQQKYQQKLTTAAEAVKIVKSGDWVDYGWCTCTPEALDKALAARYEELSDVKIRGALLTHTPAIAEVPDAAKHFTWNSWHMSGVERKMISLGMAYYAPIRYSELPRYYRENVESVDVAMFQVTPMDKHGYFNLGPNSSNLPAVLERAKKIIVEVNENMPRCLGNGNYIHIDQVEMVVEGENPPIGVSGSAAVSETDLKIAKLVMEQIPSGACLQLGIGAMPSAVGKMIAESDLKDLGVHTELYVDAFAEMTEAGKITGKCKALDPGLQVYTFALGSQKLYDFLADNPQCFCAPVDYCNGISEIAALDNFISINGAVDIDLYGQVSSESSGIRHISGAGGQQDFVMGAYKSKGGKSFICCSATVTDKKTGKVSSRIRPTLIEGSIATCTRSNTHYIVTEYGIVNLKGLSTWERAEAIISIAAPQFQEELIQAAERQGIWRRKS